MFFAIKLFQIPSSCFHLLLSSHLMLWAVCDVLYLSDAPIKEVPRIKIRGVRQPFLYHCLVNAIVMESSPMILSGKRNVPVRVEVTLSAVMCSTIFHKTNNRLSYPCLARMGWHIQAIHLNKRHRWHLRWKKLAQWFFGR